MNGHNTQWRHSAQGRRGSVRRTALILRRLLILPAVAVSALLVFSPTSSASTSSFHGSIPGCSVLVTVSGNTAQAHVTGCSGGDFWLTSWSSQSTDRRTAFPQTLFATTNSVPFSVPLPPCYWQIDFSQRATAPGTALPVGQHQVIVAAALGGSACVPATTTTIPKATTTTTVPRNSTTTVPGGTTTTTVPRTTTTTVPRTTTTTVSGGTTTTTVPGGTTTTLPGGTTTTVPGGPTTTLPGPPTTLSGNQPDRPPLTTAGFLAQEALPEAPAAIPVAHGLLAFTGAKVLVLVLLALGALAIGLTAVAAASRQPADRGPRS